MYTRCMRDFTLMIHGGAGAVPNPRDYDAALEAVLKSGQQALAQGVSALDVVELCVSLLEDDPMFNAGKGSVLTERGTVEMDAAIMSGVDMRAGAVAGVSMVKNPIQLARLVMEKTEHVMLVGTGAMEFAKDIGTPLESEEYFITEKRVQQLAEAKRRHKVVLDHGDEREKKMGTVGAVARDVHGNLAAATSTGGITNKKYGRVGDSPIVGAGVYAENATCAVSCTGYGEQFIRTALAKTIADLVRYKGYDASRAAKEAMIYLTESVRGLGGVIVIDAKGLGSGAMTTEKMLHGIADQKTIRVLT